jgi:hypothetical protein
MGFCGVSQGVYILFGLGGYQVFQMLADLAAILVVHQQMVVPDLSLFHTWLCPVRYLKEYSMDSQIQISN